MYVPDAFRVVDREVVAGFIATYGFAVVVTHGREGPFATHVPLVLERDGDRDVLLGHVARANPHWRHFDGEGEALVIFQGPHAYVSPSWYATSPAVPTWNYAVVHAYGRPRVIDDASRVHAVLERLVTRYETSTRSEPWRLSTLPPEYAERMTNAIVGFEIQVERVEAKFKLGQNRSREDIQGLIEGLVDEGGVSGRALAEFMRSAEGSESEGA
jgi:transcriptional regulator